MEEFESSQYSMLECKSTKERCKIRWSCNYPLFLEIYNDKGNATYCLFNCIFEKSGEVQQMDFCHDLFLHTTDDQSKLILHCMNNVKMANNISAKAFWEIISKYILLYYEKSQRTIYLLNEDYQIMSKWLLLFTSISDNYMGRACQLYNKMMDVNDFDSFHDSEYLEEEMYVIDEHAKDEYIYGTYIPLNTL